ncbi:MAG: uridine kinase [Acidimicrobiales bacterium]
MPRRTEPFRPFLVGVAGGTGSGKTTVAQRLADLLGTGQVALLTLDAYYLDQQALTMAERQAVNYDHPDAFDWPLLVEHLDHLHAGRSVPVPEYDFAALTRTDRHRVVGSAPVIVVEGILVLYEPALRERFDLKVYVDTDADVRFIRRLQRDVAERGRTATSVIEQYLDSVRPSHLQFIEPTKRYADVILPHGGHNDPAVEVLLARLRELVGGSPAARSIRARTNPGRGGSSGR